MNAPAHHNGVSHLSPVAREKQPQQPTEQVFDAAAFERAFDAASRDMLEQEFETRAQQEKARSKYELINERLQSETRMQDETALRGGDAPQQELSGVVDQSQASIEYATQSMLLRKENKRLLRTLRAELELDQAALSSDSNVQQDKQTSEQQQQKASNRSQAFSQNVYQSYMRQLKMNTQLKIFEKRLMELREENAAHDSNPSAQQTQQPASKGAQQDLQADELARTAGQLLDNLKDEKSEKFRQSTFMQLMRRLRDKEAMIEGENIVPVSNLQHRTLRISDVLIKNPSIFLL